MGDEWSAAALFDQDYLDFYLPLLTDEVTGGEVAVVWKLIGAQAGMPVLDLACGHGRIANRLAQQGAVVTGIDATPLFLDRARADAASLGVEVDYVEGDMREIPWQDRFDAVVSWFTAYGYFDDDQNRAVLRGIHRALRPGGRFLVEVIHKEGLLPHWVPSTVVHEDEMILIDEREWDPITGRANTWRTIIRDGTVRRMFFFVRLFSFTELRDWLLDAGFSSVEGFAGDGTELTIDARRMIPVATK